MEMVIGLFASAIAGGGAAAGGAAGLGAAAGMAGTGVAASSSLGILQGVMTAGTMLTSLVGGIGAYGEAQTSASLARLEANQAELSGEEKALRIKRDALFKAGAARVAFAASGVELGGTADVIDESIESRSRFEIGIERNNAAQRALALRMKADRYETSGLLSLIGGGAKALTAGGNYGISLAKRG